MLISKKNNIKQILKIYLYEVERNVVMLIS